MFDFEISEDKWMERRKFLLTEKQAVDDKKINATEAARLSAMISENIPYINCRRRQTILIF